MGQIGCTSNKHLNYGTKSAQYILQTEMQNILSGIPNQVNVADDLDWWKPTRTQQHSIK